MMTTTTLVSVPVPTLHRSSSFSFTSTRTISSLSPLNPVTFSVKYPYKFLCYSSFTEEEEGTSSPELLEFPPEDSDTLPNPLGGCQACGKQEIERGCNGEGRIQGGIATVPGFGWWPIKAYRPCPGFVASGGRYRRQGQSMDEVAFGRGRPVVIIEDKESKKKMKSPKGSTSN